MDLRFDEQVAIVTGSGRGLGATYASLLASRGAAVVVNDLGSAISGRGRNDGLARRQAELIRSAGGIAEPDDSDISTTEGAQALIEKALDAFGHVDIVVNNAGIYWLDDFPAIEPADLQKQLAVHIGGSFNVTRAVWEHMSERQYGRVVMTTSTGAFGSAALTSYGTAKAGVLGFGRALAQVGAGCGIKVNLVAPLGMSRMMVNVSDDDADLPRNLERAPELAAPLVAFLCHRSCPTNGETYISGSRRLSRIFIGESRGYVHSGLDLTVEDVVANWDRIEDLTDFDVCADTMSWSGRRNESLGPIRR